MTLFTGTAIPTFTAGDTTTVPTNLNVLRDALKGLSEAWTAYTPTWTASTTNPVLGNGSFSGSGYLRVEKLIIGRIVLTMGGTTTYGTGNHSLTLPVAPAAGAGRGLAPGCARDTSATADYPLYGVVVAGSTTMAVKTNPTTAGNALASMTSAVPFAWATTDVLTIEFCYEAA